MNRVHRRPYTLWKFLHIDIRRCGRSRVAQHSLHILDVAFLPRQCGNCAPNHLECQFRQFQFLGKPVQHALTVIARIDEPAVTCRKDEPLWLYNIFGEAAVSFDATMYVLWDPALPSGCTAVWTDTNASPYIPHASQCTSIPIPLGSVD